MCFGCTAHNTAGPLFGVAVHSQVTKIIFGKNDFGTRAVGVAFATTEKNGRYHARAGKEVVI